MNHNDKSPTNTAATVVKWTARLLSLASLGFVLLLAIGEGNNPLHAKPGEWARNLALGVCFPYGVCAGMILAWWRQGWGGGITVAGVFAFYAVHFAFSGTLPRGPWLAVLASPGALFLLSSLLARRNGGAAANVT